MTSCHFRRRRLVILGYVSGKGIPAALLSPR